MSQFSLILAKIICVSNTKFSEGGNITLQFNTLTIYIRLFAFEQEFAFPVKVYWQKLN